MSLTVSYVEQMRKEFLFGVESPAPWPWHEEQVPGPGYQDNQHQGEDYSY